MEPTVFSSLPNLPLFFFMFLFIYLVAYFSIFKNWSQKIRPEASSCVISLFHGTPAVFLAAYAVLSDPHRSFSSPNTVPQTTALDFSISYFLADLLHYVVFFPGDLLFIGHHLATVFVFLTCRHVTHHGAYAILSLLILAEVTSACQNTWTLAKSRRIDSQSAAKLYGLLSPYFYAFYSLVRGILGPLFVFKMASYYLSGSADSVIPRWIWFSWIIVVLMAISVSILWILNLWIEFFRERKMRMDMKER